MENTGINAAGQCAIHDVMQRFIVKYWIGKGYSEKGECFIYATDRWNAYDIFCNKYDFYTYLYDPYEINVA
jgi:hypothetical protein